MMTLKIMMFSDLGTDMRCDTCADAGDETGDESSAEGGITGDDCSAATGAVVSVETGDGCDQNGAEYL